jgi:hypothetical protein
MSGPRFEKEEELEVLGEEVQDRLALALTQSGLRRPVQAGLRRPVQD